MGLIDALDELDDVQEVFTNASLARDLLSEE
jgi:transcriptional/translational regulatory protein YebC/TACO1